jgi:hypothetical protein
MHKKVVGSSEVSSGIIISPSLPLNLAPSSVLFLHLIRYNSSPICPRWITSRPYMARNCLHILVTFRAWIMTGCTTYHLCQTVDKGILHGVTGSATQTIAAFFLQHRVAYYITVFLFSFSFSFHFFCIVVSAKRFKHMICRENNNKSCFLTNLVFRYTTLIKIPAGSPGGETECQYLSSRQYSELRQVPIISNVAAAFCRAVCNNFPHN